MRKTPIPYTNAQSKVVSDMYRAGHSYPQIAEATGRTYGSVKNHIAWKYPHLVRSKKMVENVGESGLMCGVQEGLRIAYQKLNIWNAEYYPEGKIKI